MTTFLRLIADVNKEASLLDVCGSLRTGGTDLRMYQVPPEAFRAVPGAPFAYWVSDAVRNAFERLEPFDGDYRIARITNPTSDNNRYVRTWWESCYGSTQQKYCWKSFVKGGTFSRFYYDACLVVRWDDSRQTYHGFVGTEHRPLAKPACVEHFFRPGLTWPSRTNGLSFRVMPKGCVFSGKGPAAFVSDDDPDMLLALLALLNSRAFGLLVSVQLARVELAQSFEVGLIQQTPVPDIQPDRLSKLAALARRAWSITRTIDTVEETSHAFILPWALLGQHGGCDTLAIEGDLAEIQSEIDSIAFDLYRFDMEDRAVACGIAATVENGAATGEPEDEGNDIQSAAPTDLTTGLLSWAVGVAFGRFDWQLATSERSVPPEPDPFDPLPAKSPGMLPDGAKRFHSHIGILTGDPGHPHDLARLIEEVLARVQARVPTDVRRWLQRDFFPFHLQNYSKSRRKAPIYWPLSTPSGSYTLWLYYPDLTSQMLYTAVNDFVEPKLKQLAQEVTALRTKVTVRAEDTRLEALQALESELIELRDSMLRIAPTYRPNHDDGVQITAAPLWPLFRHKPWQKVLKDTWATLENGDYDWAHLAMAYWPDRVREKCKTDKSLAIAHDLEHLYIEPPAKPAKARGRKKGADA